MFPSLKKREIPFLVRLEKGLIKQEIISQQILKAKPSKPNPFWSPQTKPKWFRTPFIKVSHHAI